MRAEHQHQTALQLNDGSAVGSEKPRGGSDFTKADNLDGG